MKNKKFLNVAKDVINLEIKALEKDITMFHVKAVIETIEISKSTVDLMLIIL